MIFNELENAKIGTDDVLKLYLGNDLIWEPSGIATNYIKKLYGRNDGSTVFGAEFGYNVKISNGIVAIVDPSLWDNNPAPGHNSEISLYDTSGNFIRRIYEDYDTNDRQNDLGHYSLAINATHIGAGHNYGDGQYFLWDINGTLIQKIERPVDFTGTRFALAASMNSTKLFIGSYNSDTVSGIYVYDMTATYLHKIVNPDASLNFGSTIYANDSYIMITSQSGVHIYDASTYSFIRTITSPETPDSFGFCLNQRGNYFYISDPQNTQNGFIRAGSLFIFNVSDGTLFTKVYDNVYASQGADFAYSFDVSDNYITVGNYVREYEGSASQGWLNVYSPTGTPVAEIRPTDLIANNRTSTYFGWSVAIESNTVVVGAWNDNDGDPDDIANTQWAGSAYLFDATTF